MFVKEYGPLIERLIDAQNEKDAFDLVKEAMNHYNGVINDAFPVIPEKTSRSSWRVWSCSTIPSWALGRKKSRKCLRS